MIIQNFSFYFFRFFLLVCCCTCLVIKQLWSQEPNRSHFPNCPEISSQRQLSSGKVVKLPICYKNSDYIALYGWGDLSETNKILAPYQLYAVPSNGKAIWQITAMDYKETTIGAYRELIIAILASPDPNLHDLGPLSTEFRLFQMLTLNLVSPTDDFGSFVIKLWVDTKEALLAGNEIWGLTKDYAKIDLLLPSTHAGFSLNLNSSQILSTRWNNLDSGGIPLDPDLDYHSISPARMWARTAVQGNIRRSEFIPGQDSFLLDSANPWAKMLRDVSFQPFEKAWILNATMQLHEPITF